MSEEEYIISINKNHLNDAIATIVELGFHLTLISTNNVFLVSLPPSYVTVIEKIKGVEVVIKNDYISTITGH